MKTYVSFIAVLAIVVFLALASNSWAYQTEAWAQVNKNNNTEHNTSGPDTDYGVNPSSYAYASWISGTFGEAIASKSGTTVTTDLNGDIFVVGETWQASAAAGYNLSGVDTAIITGPGGPGTVGMQLGLPSTSLALPAGDLGATTSVDLTLEQNGMTMQSGTATLDNYGNLTGSGLYAPSNFNVYLDGSNVYHAEYTGPALVSAGIWQVDSFFDIFYEVSAHKTAGTANDPLPPEIHSATQQIVMILPAGYELVPEPSTLVLLAVGAISFFVYGWRGRK